MCMLEYTHRYRDLDGQPAVKFVIRVEAEGLSTPAVIVQKLTGLRSSGYSVSILNVVIMQAVHKQTFQTFDRGHFGSLIF